MRQQVLTLLMAVLLSTFGKAQCTVDCVWPGDLNANGVANNLDFLTLGFSFSATGPLRANQTVLWQPLTAADWVGTIPSLGTNFKHCDADGNGLIDEQDRLPININYNQTNPDFAGFLGNNIPGDDLFIVPIVPIAAPADTLVFDIHLGTTGSPVEDIYGIGFRLVVDTQYVSEILVDYSNSWIGIPTEVLSYSKYSGDFDHAGLAITRLDGTMKSGAGSIAQVKIVITDVILGLEMDSTACIPFPIKLEYVYGIDNMGTDQLITTNANSLMLKHPSMLTSTEEIFPKQDASILVYPNPVTDHITIWSDQAPIHAIALYNSLGILVHRQQNEEGGKSVNINIKTRQLPAGYYLLQIKNGPFTTLKKVFLE